MKPIFILLGVCLLTVPCFATFDFNGTFSSDTDYQMFTFTVLADTTGVDLYTTSYATSGGFEPVLSVFRADGSALSAAQPGPCMPPLLPDFLTGVCGDVESSALNAFASEVWQAGTYTAVLSVFGNQPIGRLTDGFFIPVVMGIPEGDNFTCLDSAPGFQSAPALFPLTDAFCSAFVTGDKRNGTWILHINGVDVAQQLSTVPEPATWVYAAFGLVSLAGLRARIL